MTGDRRTERSQRYGDTLSKTETAEHYEAVAYGVTGPPDSTLISCQPTDPDVIRGAEMMAKIYGSVETFLHFHPEADDDVVTAVERAVES